MDHINKDKLVKFILYFIIVFILSLILYLMYIDFIRGDIPENYEELDINNKLANINLIKNKTFEHLNKRIRSPERYKKPPYLIKKDFLANNNQSAITNAQCTINILPDNNNNCIISSNNLYLSTSGENNFSIRVLPQGSDVSKDNSSFFTYSVTMNSKDSLINSQQLKNIRKSYFNFPSDTNYKVVSNSPRQFDSNQKYEQAIIKYFDNYAKYNNYINSLAPSPYISNFSQKELFSPGPSININHLLLLQNNIGESPFIYNSGYNYDIYNIKNKLINLYENLFIPQSTTISTTIFNMIIDDTTYLKCFFDSIQNMNVYAIELNPSVKIKFTNISLKYSGLPSSIPIDSIWSLYYVSILEITPDTESIYSYTDNIKYPVVIPLAIPSEMPSIKEWKENTTNGVFAYFESIFKKGNLEAVEYLDPYTYRKTSLTETRDIYAKNKIDETRDIYAKNKIDKFVELIGNTNLTKITDVYVLYNPSTYIFTSWIITTIPDVVTYQNITAPILSFSTKYKPSYCSNGIFYNGKCLPSCPDDYKYDFGLVCLSSNPTDYLPDTGFCDSLNEIDSNTLSLSISDDNPLAGLLINCNKNYFNIVKSISQKDIK